MARIRTIKPGFFSSLTVASLEHAARLTFIGLWTYVDDAGRGIDEPRLVKAALWPLDDDVTAADVQQHLTALENAGLIRRYTHEGKHYLVVVGFGEHQNINRPSKITLPGPDDDGSEPRGSAPGGLTEGSVRAHRGKGKEGEGKGKDSRRGAAAPASGTGPDGSEAAEAPATETRKYPKFPDLHRRYLHGAWTRFVGGVDFGFFVKQVATVYPDRPATEPAPEEAPATLEAFRVAIAADHAAWARPFGVYLALRAFARAKQEMAPQFAVNWTIQRFVSDYRRWHALGQATLLEAVA
jgi:hypothetical protein